MGRIGAALRRWRQRILRIAMAITCMALTGVLCLTATPALGFRGHVFEKTFGAHGTGGGQLNEPQGVAVNESSGDVYVIDKGNNRVEQFSASGVFVAAWGWGVSDGAAKYEICTSGCRVGIAGSGAGQLSSPTWIAVDNSRNPSDPSAGDVYVESGGRIVKYTATGSYVTTIFASASAAGVAVDGSGDLLVFTGSLGPLMAQYNDAENNALVRTLGIEGLNNAFAEDGVFTAGVNGDIYLGASEQGVDWIERASSVVLNHNGEGVVLSKAVDFGPASGLSFDVAAEELYVDNLTNAEALSAAGASVERLGEGQLTDGSGIAVNGVTETVYIADAAADTVDVFAAKPPGVPAVTGAEAEAVTGDSATLNAQITPDTEPGETGTSWYFEYGTTSCAAAPSTCARAPLSAVSIGTGFQAKSAMAHVHGLLSHAVYHYRAVAENGHGVAHGPEETFATQPGELALPDGRMWEMVSPVAKHGSVFNSLGGNVGEGSATQAAANGSAFTDMSLVPATEDPEGNAGEVQVLFQRGADAWSATDIAPPHGSVTGLEGKKGHGTEYRLFSEDLSTGVIEAGGLEATSLAGEVKERTLWLRDTQCGSEQACSDAGDALYQPLVSEENVLPGTKFGGEYGGGLSLSFQGATPDMKHIIIRSEVALASPPASKGLYEWTDGKLQFVSLLPGEPGVAAVDVFLGGEKDYRNAVSADGQRVVWSGEESTGGKRYLFLRDLTSKETLKISENHGGGGPSGGLNDPMFQFASADGSKIFFIDEEELTPDSKAAYQHPDLYVFELSSGPGEALAGKLVDLTAASAGGETADVQGQALGIGEDSAHDITIYYVANGVLAGDATPGHCAKAASGGRECNLYMQRWWASTGSWEQPVLVARLSQADQPDWSELSKMTARVSPNGEWLTFMSGHSLTGYDNGSIASGQPAEEVYLYHASANVGEEGKLVCASCNPTGQRPAAAKLTGRSMTTTSGTWPETTWLAADIPGWTEMELAEAHYQSRYLSDEGRLFFNSFDALAPQAINHTWDVYEYEPPGVGSCSTAQPSYSQRAVGCVDLISGGISPEESAFLDASENGDDVFFLTAEKLVARDTDTAYDIYDAHVCSSELPCVGEPESTHACMTTDSCREALRQQPSVFGAPSSATFSGKGDLAPPTSKSAVKGKALTWAQKLKRALSACRKKKTRKRAACERRARKSYGATTLGSKSSREDKSSGRGRR